MESGVSENAVSGHIQYIRPGHSACFAVIFSLLLSKYSWKSNRSLILLHGGFFREFMNF